MDRQSLLNYAIELRETDAVDNDGAGTEVSRTGQQRESLSSCVKKEPPSH